MKNASRASEDKNWLLDTSRIILPMCFESTRKMKPSPKVYEYNQSRKLHLHTRRARHMHIMYIYIHIYIFQMVRAAGCALSRKRCELSSRNLICISLEFFKNHWKSSKIIKLSSLEIHQIKLTKLHSGLPKTYLEVAKLRQPVFLCKSNALKLVRFIEIH